MHEESGAVLPAMRPKQLQLLHDIGNDRAVVSSQEGSVVGQKRYDRVHSVEVAPLRVDEEPVTTPKSFWGCSRNASRVALNVELWTPSYLKL